MLVLSERGGEGGKGGGCLGVSEEKSCFGFMTRTCDWFVQGSWGKKSVDEGKSCLTLFRAFGRIHYQADEPSAKMKRKEREKDSYFEVERKFYFKLHGKCRSL